jgi:hypothetical protein
MTEAYPPAQVHATWVADGQIIASTPEFGTSSARDFEADVTDLCPTTLGLDAPD